MSEDRNGKGRPLRAIGLMSGTSLDGIDVAMIETDGRSTVRRGPARVYPYDDDFRHRLAAGLKTAKYIARRDERPGSLVALEGDLTDRHAEAVRTFAADCGVDLSTVDVVGFHGQTVLHRPERGLTVQLGDGQRLADAIDVPVVFDMRASDMELGGQGAPLAPAYHRALASDPSSDGPGRGPVVFVNIGGISNVTFIDGTSDPIAFDSGPGNALLDQWLEREAATAFDRDGEIAAKGRVIERLADRYLSHDFFRRPVPKSLDRFDFDVPPSTAGSLEDVARTLCFVTAGAVMKAAAFFPASPGTWIICGGGRHHPAIMHDLREGAGKGADVVSAEEAGFDGDAIEAEAWAYLAVRSLAGLPLTWPTTTGCRQAATGGVLATPTITEEREKQRA